MDDEKARSQVKYGKSARLKGGSGKPQLTWPEHRTKDRITLMSWANSRFQGKNEEKFPTSSDIRLQKIQHQ
ncbi:hypothetical protein IHQ56_09695 [Methylobacillus flagellatus]|nr:hypothetical protein [Methylobacillus flagellatus]